MKLLSFSLPILLICSLETAHAAVPGKLDTTAKKPIQLSVEDKKPVLMALRMPFDNRIDALKAQGEKAFSVLENLAFDSKETLGIRWKSLTALARVQGQNSISMLEKALVSPEWYMRNAAMVAVLGVDKNKGIEWAKKLIQDDSLVVRTAAVQTLSSVQSEDIKETLWRELYSERNYRNGKSLWIRKHIVRTLSFRAKANEVEKFAKLLRDADPRLHPWAVLGLEKSTGRILGDSNSNWTDKRERWLSYFDKDTSINL